MSDPVSEAVELAAQLCKPFEGLRLKPYICPAGFPTIVMAQCISQMEAKLPWNIHQLPKKLQKVG